jgi:zinc protease
MLNKLKACYQKYALLWLIIALALLGIVGSRYMVNSAMRAPIEKNLSQPTEVMPSSSLQSRLALLDLKHWTTDSGARVHYVYSKAIPIVDIEIALDAGAVRDGKQAGLAYLTNSLLAEGTAQIDANEVAETLETVGAKLSTEVYQDMAIVHIRVLNKPEYIHTALKVVAKILKQPAFPENGLQRAQQQGLTLLQYEAQRPQKIAEKNFYALLYANHPYGNWPHGTPQTINAITRKDLLAFHQQYYVTNNLVVAIVGDIDMAAAKKLAETLTQQLPKGHAAPPLPMPELNQAPLQKHITFPAKQTHIMLGMPLITRKDPDYFALYVGNHILGNNGSVSRLFNVIRHEYGLAYDVHSYLLPMRVPGPYILDLQTQNSQALPALKALQHTLAKFIEEGPTVEELANAKQNLLGGFALRFDTNQEIAAAIAMMGFYQLPRDYFDRFMQQIEQVSLAEIKSAYQQRIDSKNMSVVMIGGGDGL